MYCGLFSMQMYTETHQVRIIIANDLLNNETICLFSQGGTLIEYEGKQRLLEIAQVPKEHVSAEM